LTLSAGFLAATVARIGKTLLGRDSAATLISCTLAPASNEHLMSLATMRTMRTTTAGTSSGPSAQLDRLRRS
jgi:hypothetical protein